MYPTIQGDILGNFIDKDMHYKRTGEMRIQKYLKKASSTALNAL